MKTYNNTITDFFETKFELAKYDAEHEITSRAIRISVVVKRAKLDLFMYHKIWFRSIGGIR